MDLVHIKINLILPTSSAKHALKTHSLLMIEKLPKLIGKQVIVLLATKVNLQLREIDFVIPVLLVENEKIHLVRIAVQESLENLRRVVLTVQQDTIKIHLVQLHAYHVFRKTFAKYFVLLSICLSSPRFSNPSFFSLLHLLLLHLLFLSFPSAVNLIMILVLLNAKLALQIHTLIKREEIQVALVVQQAGRQKKAAPSVNLARLGLSAASKVQLAKIVKSVSIVKVKRKMPMVN